MNKLILSLLFTTFISLGQTPCSNGFSGSYPCDGLDLIAHLDLNVLSASSGNDSWGWTDPLDAKEYALMGLNNGTAFIDISQPTSPVYLGKLPTHTSNSQWRDIKVYGNYAFIVSEASGHGMQVFDLTKLRTVTSPPEIFVEDAHYDGFGNAHNIVINPNQPYAYAVGTQTYSGGPHVVDISDPLNPVIAGGYAASFYSHDAQVITYNGPDSDYQGDEIYIGSNEDEVVILNVTEKSNINTISTIAYTNIGYTHQAWLTQDENYLILGDEFDELDFGFNTRSIIFDLTDLDNPSVHMEYVGDTPSIDHNGYVKNGKYYQASYTGGLRIIDINDIANQNINEVAYFDTYPQTNSVGFDGLWNVYPYFESGNLVLSDINTGFYLVRDSSLSTQAFQSNDALKVYPNPAEDVVNITTNKDVLEHIKIFNQIGQLVFETKQIGGFYTSLQVSDFPSGIYLITVNKDMSTKMIIK